MIEGVVEISESRALISAEANAPWWHDPSRTKVCIRCGETKPVSEFYAYGYTTGDGKRSTRYESRCRPCAQARRREAYHRDPAGEAAAAKRWRDRNAEWSKEYNRTRQTDPEVRRLKAYHQRLRKARIRAGGVGDSAAIRAIYAQAMEIERIVADCPVFDLPELGKKMHVDHIMPLIKGGLHAVDNLQILPIGINMRKGAKW